MKGNWLLAGSMDETISLHNLQKNQNVVAAECGSNCRGVVSVDLHSDIEAAVTNQADGTSLFWQISFVWLTITHKFNFCTIFTHNFTKSKISREV